MAGLRTQWKRSLEIPQCFSHGDAHLGNMFFEIDGRPGFLDCKAWQEGPYLHALASSIIGTLTVEDTRAADKDLLAGYLQALSAHFAAHPPIREVPQHAYLRPAMHVFNGHFNHFATNTIHV